MNKIAKTIGMIALVALLAVPLGIVFAGMPGNPLDAGDEAVPVFPWEEKPPVVEPPEPPPAEFPTTDAQPSQEVVPQPIRKVFVAEDRPVPAVFPWEEKSPVVEPPEPPPAEFPTTDAQPSQEIVPQPIRKVFVRDDHVAPSVAMDATLWPAWRIGGSAVGRARTEADEHWLFRVHVHTDLWLWWWDGTAWVLKSHHHAFDSCPKPVADILGFTPGVTGWWATTSRHRTWLGLVLVHDEPLTTRAVWLVFP